LSGFTGPRLLFFAALMGCTHGRRRASRPAIPREISTTVEKTVENRPVVTFPRQEHRILRIFGVGERGLRAFFPQEPRVGAVTAP